MGAMDPGPRRANGLDQLRSLLPSADATDYFPWSAQRLKAVSEAEVHVIACEHANADSLPLRFGVHFPSDTVITLKRIEFLNVDADHSDRFHVDAWSSFNGEDEQSAHFVLGQRSGFANLVLVTVWRYDTNTEFGLSEVMKALRKKELLTSATLRKLHPLYRDGKLKTHADLVEQLARELSNGQISQLREVADEAMAKAAKAIAERDQAVERAQKAERVAEQLAEDLEAERKRFERELADAKREGQTASLSTPNALVEVLERHMYRGSSCTILLMGDGSRRFMKTATFDPDGRVTAKAKSLIGRQVRISCWDPVGQPGRWSREGYFRNIYAAA